ncbi:MAG: hypothetical protein ACOX2X_04120 [Peptococcia bacterium]
MLKYILIASFLLLVLAAIKTKKRLKRWRDIADLDNAVESPTSYAIGELVAVAGGIYLSLVLLGSFLKISMPERIVIYSWSFDYLAAIALVLALIQPIFLSIYYRITRRI